MPNCFFEAAPRVKSSSIDPLLIGCDIHQEARLARLVSLLFALVSEWRRDGRRRIVGIRGVGGAISPTALDCGQAVTRAHPTQPWNPRCEARARAQRDAGRLRGCLRVGESGAEVRGLVLRAVTPDRVQDARQATRQ